MTEVAFHVPVLVAGGGACGCVAALSARDTGADVLLIEPDARPMGTTGMSQGLVAAAGTRAQAAHGVEDSGELFLADIVAKTRGLADPTIARAIAHGSGPAIDWLTDAHDLPWTLDTGFRPAYGHTRYRVHGWHGHSGQDMVDLLHARAASAGVDVLLRARLVDVEAGPDGRVAAAVIERPDGSAERIGCDALVLACGGFAANRAMVAQHMPEAAHARNNGHEGSDGTAVRLGSKLGAAVGDMGAYQGYGMLTDPQGITAGPGLLVEGGVLVNAHGRRFVDETQDIAGIVHPVLAQPGGQAWVIYDARIAALVAYVPEMKALEELRAPRVADSPAALAEAVGLPVDALTDTLADAHRAAAAGLPDAVERRWREDRPPHGELRALKVTGAIYHTQGGLQIDSHAGVVRVDGTRIPNLFAGGGAARSVSGPSYWGYMPAMGLATAVTLGRIAGQSAAAEALATQRSADSGPR